MHQLRNVIRNGARKFLMMAQTAPQSTPEDSEETRGVDIKQP
eukprot:gene17792-5588_t